MKRISRVQPYFSPENVAKGDPNAFPAQFPVFLDAQKKEILRRLRTSHSESLDVPATEAAARKQLSELIQGTIARGEGNSCIVLGPRGSGKTRVSLNKFFFLCEN
jgi:origin recognition complex subunit 4